MKNELIKAGTTAVELADVDTQMSLFKKFNLAPTMAERYRFIQKEGGKLALVKRNAPIKIFEDHDGVAAVAALQASYSERMKLNACKGKYNDEERLAGPADPTGLELGEVQPFTRPF